MWLKSERWRFVLRGWGIDYPRQKAFRAYLIAAFLGLVTPLKVGQFSRGAFLVRDAQAPVSSAMTSVVLDRLLDVLLLVLLALPLVDRALGLSSLQAFFMTALVGAGFLGATALMRVHPVHGIGWAHSGKAGETHALLLSKTLLPVLLWTVAGYAVFFGLALLLGTAVGLELSWMDLIPVLALVNLLSVIPITLAGIGTREVALVVLLAPYGVSAESATVFGMAYFLCFYVSSALFGAVELSLDSSNGQIDGRGETA